VGAAATPPASVPVGAPVNATPPPPSVPSFEQLFADCGAAGGHRHVSGEFRDGVLAAAGPPRRLVVGAIDGVPHVCAAATRRALVGGGGELRADAQPVLSVARPVRATTASGRRSAGRIADQRAVIRGSTDNARSAKRRTKRGARPDAEDLFPLPIAGGAIPKRAFNAWSKVARRPGSTSVFPEVSAPSSASHFRRCSASLLLLVHPCRQRAVADRRGAARAVRIVALGASTERRCGGARQRDEQHASRRSGGGNRASIDDARAAPRVLLSWSPGSSAAISTTPVKTDRWLNCGRGFMPRQI
jgi:hypothetical protein